MVPFSIIFVGEFCVTIYSMSEFLDWDIETLVRITENPQAFENYIINTLNNIIEALKEEGFDLEHLPNNL